METVPYVERDVLLEGLKLHYQEWGDSVSPPIVMLHGFGLSGHMFDEFGRAVCDRYHLFALDQRGHGDSDWSDAGDYSRDAFVADLEHFRESAGLDTFVLMGHSMGGLNAVAYAAGHPERVRALVLVDVGPEAAREGVDNIVRFTRGPDRLEFDEFVEMAHRFNPRRSLDNIRERMRHRLKPAEDGKWTWKFDARFRDPEAPLRVGSDLGNEQTWDLFRSVPVPTLIVRGGESDVLTQETAERASREMEDARLVVVPGAGHSVPGDAPGPFSEAVLEFLAGLEIEPRAEPATLPGERPTLDELVDSHPRPRQRMGTGSLAVIAGAVAAAVAVGGAILMLRSRSKKKSRQRLALARARSAAVARAPDIDLQAARLRALQLLDELSGAGRESLDRARGLLETSQLARARDAAGHVLHDVGEPAGRAVRRAGRRGQPAGRRSLRTAVRGARTTARLALRGGRAIAAAGRGRRS